MILLWTRGSTLFFCHTTFGILGFPGGSDCKEPAYNAGDPGSNLGLGISLEKEMATHSSILAWRIPWTEEPGSSDTTEHARTPHM